MAEKCVNRVEIIGRLGKDADTKFTQSGKACTSFSIATSYRFKNKDGDWVDSDAEWHNIVVWGAENLAQYLTKGKRVRVEGRLQTRSWEDKEGTTRYKTEIVVQSGDIMLLSQDRDQQQPVSAPRGQQKKQNGWGSSKPAESSWGSDVPTDDDVPF